VAYVYTHLVLASKFSLPPITPGVKGNYTSYELDEFTIDHILKALAKVELLEVATSDDWIVYVDDVANDGTTVIGDGDEHDDLSTS
jgi:hypothetical protein